MSIQFIVDLVDRVSGKAKTVENSLMGTYEGTKKLEEAMKGLEGAMLKASALGREKQFRTLERQLKKLSVAAEASRSQVGRFGMAFGELKEGISKMLVIDPVEIFRTIGETAVEAAAKVGELALEFGHMAIEASEAKEKLLASFVALTGGEEAGGKTLAMIRELEKHVPQSEAQLADWSKQLLGAGVSADSLQSALQAVAGSEALVGGGQRALQLITQLQEMSQAGTKIRFNMSTLAGTGVTESEMMKALGMTPRQLELAKKQGALTGQQLSDALITVLHQKGTGPIAEQTRDLSAQWTKLKDNVMRMFEDVDLSPFLDALKSLFGIFDQGTNSGKAMKAGITGALNAVFKFIADGLPKVRHFFLEMIVWGLKAYITVKEHFTAIKAVAAVLFGALVGGLVALGTVGAIALAPLIASFATLAVGVLAATWPIVAIGAAVGALAFVFVHYKDIAKNFIAGLVDGIVNGGKAAIDAVKNLGHKLISSLKGVLGIHSPSVEMMKLGVHTGTGFANGVEASNDNVASAASGLSVAATSGVTGGGGPSAATVGRAGASVHVDSIVIQIDGAQSPKATSEAVVSELSNAFETLALTQGLGSAA